MKWQFMVLQELSYILWTISYKKNQVESVFQKKIKQYLGVSRSTITGNLKRLEAKG